MKRSFFIVLATFVFAAGVFAQSVTKDSPVLMTVGNENVTLDEFEAIFRKNNNNKTITKESLDEYVDLFVKFKLKVKEAKELQMDTSKTFKNELTGYVKQLAMPYLKDKDAEEKLVEEAYERLKSDLKIRHILVRVPACANPKDTLAAWNKIMKIRKDILKSKNFEDAATRFSEDSLSARNGGLIGYFTALSLSYPFESAAYNLKQDDISMPVRTSYGYHIIKVDDRRPARGKVKIAHIFISAPNKNDEKQYNEAKNKINEAFAKIQAGEEFASVVRTYSEDYNSTARGGELAPFGINQMVQEFEDLSFSLKNPDEVSKPFETPIGFHIVKLIEKIQMPAFEDYKAELSKNVQKNKRWQVVKDAFTATLKKQYSFEENTKLIETIDAAATRNGGKLTKAILNSIAGDWLFKIKGNAYSYSDFINTITPKMANDASMDMCTFRTVHYDPYVAQKLIDYKESNLANEYPEFKMLVNEYRDGILLFNLMDQKVWTRSVKDTAGLKEFHELHKNNYMWGDRLHAYIIDCKNDEADALARKYAQKLIDGKLTLAKFKETVNKKVVDNIFISEGIYSKGENALVDKVGDVGISPTEKVGEKIKFAIVDRKVAPEPKQLKEAKGLVISDYQNYLEAEWVKELEGKYKVSVNKDVLYSLIGK